MRNKISAVCIFLMIVSQIRSQDTFSIVAVDSTTKEVGSAGASCVDLFNFVKEPDFIGELFPGKGAINTQASYDEFNQGNAAQKMNEDSTPKQIIDWLVLNDVGGTPQVRQYGIASLVKGNPKTEGFTGANCMNWKGHRTGPNYCIQGNILLGQQVIDSMEARFLREKGDLKAKLMAAMQGAKMIGADTRCAPNNSSTLFAYLKVAKHTDIDGSLPSFIIKVKTKMNDKIEPIDSLQKLYDAKVKSTSLKSKNNEFLSYQLIDDKLIFTNNSNEFVDVKLYNLLGQIITTARINAHDNKLIEANLNREETIILSVSHNDLIDKSILINVK